ncbi:hypothetical protein HN481_04875, partial [Candidatus Parcubacteria bacterium]|nr:hypothetical protein [Candidatus Parcubacteria bacterium]
MPRDIHTHPTERPENEHFKDMGDLSAYKKDTNIVVNVDGDWVQGVLVEDIKESDFDNGKLRLEVSVGGTKIPPMTVGETPQFVKYHGIGKDTIQDAKLGNFKLKDTHVTEDGRIEYTIAEPGPGSTKEHIGVPQELLDIWIENIELDNRLAALQTELAKLPSQKQIDFSDRNRDMQKMVEEISAQIPNVEEMSDQDKEQALKLQDSIEGITKKADELIKALEEEVSDILTTTPGAAPSSPDYHHVMTEAEREAAAKEGESKAEHAKDLKQALAKQVKDEISKIEKVETKELEKVRDQKEQEFDDKLTRYKEDMEDWDDARRPGPKQTWTDRTTKSHAGKPRHPGSFRRDNVKLPVADSRAYADQKQEVEDQVYIDFIENTRLSTEDQEIVTQLESLRKEFLKKKDRFAKTADLNGAGDDYKKPTDPKGSRYLEVSKQVLDALLDDRAKGKGYEEPKVPKGKETFDYATLQQELMLSLDGVLTSVPLKENNGKPENDYKTLYKTVETYKNTLPNKFKNLQSVDAAKAAGIVLFKTGMTESERLREIREDQVRVISTYIDTLKEDHAKISLSGKQKEIKKEVEETYKSVESATDSRREKKEAVVDIPEYLMKELMKMRHTEVGAAVTSLFDEGTINESTGKVSTGALDIFKNIFDGDDPPPADVLKKLRDSGIKDWKKFKTLWDNKLAERSVHVMNEMAKAVVHRHVSESITWGDQMKKQWGQITGRMATNIAAVTGIAIVANLATAGGATLAALAAVGTTAVAGGARALIGKYIFGHKRMEDRKERQMAELRESKRGAIVTELSEKVMDNLLPSGAVPPPIPGKKPKIMEELPSFAGVMAQTLRDITSEMHKLGGEEPSEAKDLKENGRALYEQALANLELKDRGPDTKRKLAIAISKMTGTGEKMEHNLSEITDSKIKGVIEAAVQSYAGKKGVAMGTAGGLVVGAAIFVGAEWGRAGLGAVLGGTAGYKEGKARDLREIRNQAMNRTGERVAHVRTMTETILKKGKGEWNKVSDADKQNVRGELDSLKRLLSANASPADMAAFGIVGEKEVTVKIRGREVEKNCLVDANNNPIIDLQTGEVIAPDVKMFMQDIRSAIRDAERAGIIFEKEEDRGRLDKVKELMTTRGDELSKAVDEKIGLWGKFAAWGKRNRNTILYTTGGALLGGSIGAGAIYVSSGDMLRDWGVLDDVKSGTLDASAVSAAAVEYAKAHPDQSTLVPDGTDAAEAIPAGSGSGDALDLADQGADTGAPFGDPKDIDTADIGGEEVVGGVEAGPRTPEVSSLNIQDIKKGEGILHGVNRALREVTAGNDSLSGMSDQEIHTWKIQELKNMGFVFQDGKWGYPMTVHEGAQVELFTDPEGQPHFRVVGEEGSTVTSHEHIKFRDPVVGDKTPDVPATETQAPTETVQPTELEIRKAAAAEFAEERGAITVADDALKEELEHLGGKIDIENIEVTPYGTAILNFDRDGFSAEIDVQKVYNPETESYDWHATKPAVTPESTDSEWLRAASEDKVPGIDPNHAKQFLRSFDSLADMQDLRLAGI